MMLLKSILLLSVFTTFALAACPVTDNPRAIIECLRYITSGLYGAAIQDLKIICRIASDIAYCAKDELGECIAAEIGRAALSEVETLAKFCCPNRNDTRCPIRESVVKDQKCFAANSLVTLANGESKSIAHLSAGDVILAYDDASKRIIHTPVLTMLDFQPHHFALFKHITTNTGRQLSLTSSHLLPTPAHGYVMAKDVRTGMSLLIVDGDGVLISDEVSSVSDVVKQGYMAPLTREGTLIVNNVAASCYATIQSHQVAHGVLAPMRWWYSLFGLEKASSASVGVHWFPQMLYEITTFLVPSIIHA